MSGVCYVTDTLVELFLSDLLSVSTQINTKTTYFIKQLIIDIL